MCNYICINNANSRLNLVRDFRRSGRQEEEGRVKSGTVFDIHFKIPNGWNTKSGRRQSDGSEYSKIYLNPHSC